MILSWLVYPLVLAALGGGWGVLVEKAMGREVTDALVIPLGLAAVLVIGGLFTAFSGTAPIATPVCGVGAVAGLVWGRPWRRVSRWPALAAIGVVIAYGLPVLLSGHATFLGYLRLDDTATWLDITDNIMAHGRSVSGLPPSTYALVMSGDVGPAYPLGAFALFGVSQQFVGIDLAWIFQPYLACCGAAIALSIYALAEPLIVSPRRRALVAFLAAQPALLYGYSLWGGIKELTAAFLLVLGMALAARVIMQRPERGRELLGVALCAGGLLISLSVGAGAWLAPAFAIVFGAWTVLAWRKRQTERLWWRGPLVSTAWLGGLTAACAVPLWAVVHSFLSNDAGLFNAGQDTATTLGNLIQPLSGYQLAGVWTIGDFRYTAPAFPTAWLVVIVIAVAGATLAVTIQQRRFGLPAYVAVALLGCLIFSLAGSTPWVMGKALAIASPALLTAALIGATMLWGRWGFGFVLVVVIAFGVIASNLSGYHDALLAPKDRLAELQRIGQLVSGKGPTFVNDYEVYADRHFLRDGAPVEPAEYREADLPTTTGALLVKTAYADLDSFSLATLLPYRSVVVRNSPVESRPPSLWNIVWSGRYYQLYQRAAHPSEKIIEHIPLGDQGQYPYCGAAESGSTKPLCSVAPASIPPCTYIRGLAARASRDGARLVAYQRPLPIVVRGDDLQWPAPWYHDDVGHTLTPYSSGTAVAHIVVNSTQDYEFWLGGSFTRGFQVKVDGHAIGQAKDEIFDIAGYVPMAKLHLTSGVHTVDITYPSADIWTPGTGNNEYTTLQEIALQPLGSPSYQMLNVAPSDASSLCGRPLDWIELVAPAA
jgi:hypothetical protein